MVTIRLMRIGKKGQPLYRVVVQEAGRKTRGRYLEALGHYRPQAAKDSAFQIRLDRVKLWQARGASTSAAVRSLLRRAKA